MSNSSFRTFHILSYLFISFLCNLFVGISRKFGCLHQFPLRKINGKITVCRVFPVPTVQDNRFCLRLLNFFRIFQKDILPLQICSRNLFYGPNPFTGKFGKQQGRAFFYVQFFFFSHIQNILAYLFIPADSSVMKQHSHTVIHTCNQIHKTFTSSLLFMSTTALYLLLLLL